MWAYASVSSVSNPGAIREILAPQHDCIIKTARSNQRFAVDLAKLGSLQSLEVLNAND
jgi:hypothetical protein